jgi:threonine dehydratase/serine racemase
MSDLPTVEDVRHAAARIEAHAHRTPVVTSRSIDERVGARVFFKCENLQRVGAFKFRGACNTVMSLSDEEAARGVATHSSGNHAQAVALAARIRGIAAHIVMPRNAPPVKRAAVLGYGARVVPCEPTLASRQATLSGVVEDTGATAIHPYDDARVIAGQGTAALELLDQVSELSVITAPVGGGGLISGTAVTVAALSPSTRVVAAEPEAADDAFRSFHAGRIVPSEDPTTICDGLKTSLGELNFALIRRHVSDIVTVSEEAVATAMRYFVERTKLLIEPSAAVPLAAVLEGKVRGDRIGVILSGGNVDLASLFERLAPI